MKRILPNAETHYLCLEFGCSCAEDGTAVDNKACANTSKASALAAEFTPTHPTDHYYSNFTEP